jgi:hypothetical protein
MTGQIHCRDPKIIRHKARNELPPTAMGVTPMNQQYALATDRAP